MDGVIPLKVKDPALACVELHKVPLLANREMLLRNRFQSNGQTCFPKIVDFKDSYKAT